jgi:hypothetical protein
MAKFLIRHQTLTCRKATVLMACVKVHSEDLGSSSKSRAEDFPESEEKLERETEASAEVLYTLTSAVLFACSTGAMENRLSVDRPRV